MPSCNISCKKFYVLNFYSIFEVIYSITQHKLKMRALLIFITLILQLILGWHFYTDHKNCCSIHTKELLAPEKQDAPLTFQWSSAVPLTGSAWPGIKDSLTRAMGENQYLEITGWYCRDEQGQSDNDTLGKTRALAVRALFTDLPDDKILFKNKLVSCDSLDKNLPFEAITLNIRTLSKNIIETENETLIYFPSNSTSKLNARDVEDYLNNVAKRVIQSGEKILLIGYTDDSGPESNNIILGQKRADVIKNYLINAGVPANQVQATSDGEKNPVSDNSTAEGRAKNRRTVLQITR
jgi:outer membrane protein OmpA-like peptidoglycan-associated protein